MSASTQEIRPQMHKYTLEVTLSSSQTTAYISELVSPDKFQGILIGAKTGSTDATVLKYKDGSGVTTTDAIFQPGAFTQKYVYELQYHVDGAAKYWIWHDDPYAEENKSKLYTDPN